MKAHKKPNRNIGLSAINFAKDTKKLTLVFHTLILATRVRQSFYRNIPRFVIYL